MGGVVLLITSGWNCITVLRDYCAAVGLSEAEAWPFVVVVVVRREGTLMLEKTDMLVT